MPYINQEEAVKLGRDHWEREYRRFVRNRGHAIQTIMQACSGMEPDQVLEEFAANQFNGIARALRLWIDQTFPLQPGNRS